MKPSVAIVILNWNGSQDTLDCLGSLDRGGYLSLPVLVVDNGSNDNSAETIKTQYPSVSLIELKENLGFTGGCNSGLRWGLEQKADWVCLLNNDTIVTPGFLEKLLKTTQEHPGAGILAPRVNYADPGNRVWSQGITVNRLSGRIITSACGKHSEQVADQIKEYPAVSGAAMLISQKVLKTAGFFDDDFFLCYEDVDLCLRARAHGFKVMVVPASLVYHKISASMGGEGSDAIIYYSTRNQLLVLNRRFPLPSAGRWLRNFLVAGYTLLFVLITSRTPPRRGLRTWAMGIRDFFRGQLKKRGYEDSHE